jgi:hypothetical protein
MLTQHSSDRRVVMALRSGFMHHHGVTNAAPGSTASHVSDQALQLPAMSQNPGKDYGGDWLSEHYGPYYLSTCPSLLSQCYYYLACILAPVVAHLLPTLLRPCSRMITHSIRPCRIKIQGLIACDHHCKGKGLRAQGFADLYARP